MGVLLGYQHIVCSFTTIAHHHHVFKSYNASTATLTAATILMAGTNVFKRKWNFSHAVRLGNAKVWLFIRIPMLHAHYTNLFVLKGCNVKLFFSWENELSAAVASLV
jgi:hypothetical protein